MNFKPGQILSLKILYFKNHCMLLTKKDGAVNSGLGWIVLQWDDSCSQKPWLNFQFESRLKADWEILIDV